MKRDKIVKTTFLIAAIVMFGLIPVYCFFWIKKIDLDWWIPIVLLLGMGVLCLVNYFIIHVEPATKIERK